MLLKRQMFCLSLASILIAQNFQLRIRRPWAPLLSSLLVCVLFRSHHRNHSGVIVIATELTPRFSHQSTPNRAPGDWRSMYAFPVNHACDRQVMQTLILASPRTKFNINNIIYEALSMSHSSEPSTRERANPLAVFLFFAAISGYGESGQPGLGAISALPIFPPASRRAPTRSLNSTQADVPPLSISSAYPLKDNLT